MVVDDGHSFSPWVFWGWLGLAACGRQMRYVVNGSVARVCLKATEHNGSFMPPPWKVSPDVFSHRRIWVLLNYPFRFSQWFASFYLGLKGTHCIALFFGSKALNNGSFALFFVVVYVLL